MSIRRAALVAAVLLAAVAPAAAQTNRDAQRLNALEQRLEAAEKDLVREGERLREALAQAEKLAELRARDADRHLERQYQWVQWTAVVVAIFVGVLAFNTRSAARLEARTTAQDEIAEKTAEIEAKVREGIARIEAAVAAADGQVTEAVTVRSNPFRDSAPAPAD